MTQDLTDSYATVKSSVDEAAYTVYKRWRQWTEIDDLRQQIWMWMASDWPTISKMERPKLLRGMRNAAERYARKEKAAHAGYSPSDEQFYSLDQVERLVWDAFDPEAVPAREPYRDDERYSEWVTEVADVRRVVDRLPVKHRLALYDYTQKTREKDEGVIDALWAVVRALGGSRPR